MFFRKNKNATTEPTTARKQSGGNALSRRFHAQDERPTTLLEEVRPPTEPPPRPPARNPANADSETRILSEVQSQPVAIDDPMQDPPVGWLVIVDGPGKGRSLCIGYGMNAVGRASSQRVCLDFGDPRISRENHALITYDGKARRFYVQHGGGPNLTYLGDLPVLSPVELKPGARINLGNTVLLFVPLCSAEFDWMTADDPHKQG